MCKKSKFSTRDTFSKSKIGLALNSLTIIDTVYKDNIHYMVCKCICNNIKEYKFGDLKNGMYKSCGCLKEYYRKTSVIDNRKHLLNKVFNNFTIINFKLNSDLNIETYCKCSCGNIETVNHKALVKNKIHFCSNCKNYLPNKRTTNWTSYYNSMLNKKYNKLLVLGVNKTYNTVVNKNNTKLKCLCDCGKTTLQRRSDIEKGVVKSCGCHKNEILSVLGTKKGLNNSKSYKNKYKWHYIKDGIKINMRSGYEVLYAKTLTENNIEWLYEPESFKLSNAKRYTPDFYLSSTNEWIDVKGWYREEAKKKIELFESMGYNIKVLRLADIENISSVSYKVFMKNWKEEFKIK